MTKARLDGLTLLILGSVLFVAIGAVMEFTNPLGMKDFQQFYVSARCVAHHHDPYNKDELAAFYRADVGGLSADSGVSHTVRLIVLTCNNLPTTLFFVAPLAAMPWSVAVAVWMALIAVAFIIACFRVWSFGADSSPRLCGALIFLILVNSGLLLSSGNTAGLVVSLAVIAVCCFLKDRFVVAGIVCLAVALAMKPHDAGPIWLYFLLAGGVQRKRALQSAALTAAILIPAVLWVWHSAPHWAPELHANLAEGLAPGGLNNAGPTTQGGRGIGQIISLQAVLSLIRDDARFYNSVTYVICGIPLLLWCVRTLRIGFSPRNAWLALAAIAPLTMLPFYHRTYDARLLLLAVPACASLWMGGHARGRSALGLTLAAIILTGDLFWIVLFQATHYSGWSTEFGTIPAPLVLLALGIFCLWIYLRSDNTASLSGQMKAES